jgi:diguanylate cyclase (GGDEF)-like protein
MSSPRSPSRSALIAGLLILTAGALAVGALQRQRATDRARSARESAWACGTSVERSLADLAAGANAAGAAYDWGAAAGWLAQATTWTEARQGRSAFLVAADGTLLRRLGTALERLPDAIPVAHLADSSVRSAAGVANGRDRPQLALALRRVGPSSPPTAASTPAWAAAALSLDLLLAPAVCTAAAAYGGWLELSLPSLDGEATTGRIGQRAAAEGPILAVELDAEDGALTLAAGVPPPPLRPLLLVAILTLLGSGVVYGWVSPATHLEETLAEQKRQLERANVAWLDEVERREHAERELSLWESRDALTRLPNRRDLLRRLDQGLERARSLSDFALGVMCIGLDRFKNVNESLGHGGGDRFIAELGRRLLTATRPEGEPARIEGDRFAVALFDVGTEERATEVAQRICREASEPIVIEGHEIFPALSVGVFVSTLGLEQSEGALLKAEIAMNEAKAAGGERVVMFDSTMTGAAGSKLQLESDLRRAVGAGEFEVHYQPVMALDTGRLVGLEALLRWRHPRDGLVMPDRFIPLAEETGLIVPLTRWVLTESFRQLAEWRTQAPGIGDLYISVNLSGRDLDEPSLVDSVRELITANRLPPGSIRIEVTESSLMRDLARTAGQLEEFHRLEIPLLLDDFGTGYSSLSYLHSLPFDFVKIDRSFVRALSQPQGDHEIVRAIVDLTHCFGMQAVAEGIENVNDVTMLQGLGCEFGQGYHYSKALAATRVLPFVLANSR